MFLYVLQIKQYVLCYNVKMCSNFYLDQKTFSVCLWTTDGFKKPFINKNINLNLKVGIVYKK